MPHQLFPEVSDTAMGNLVHINMVRLVEPEQGHFGIVANLCEALIDNLEAVGESVIGEPEPTFNPANTERVQAVAYPAGCSRPISKKTCTAAKSCRIISNKRSASSGVHAATSRV
jgi:hypothetical protein